MNHHGGRLKSVVKKYQRPVEKWIDVSAAINPESWPVPEIPQNYFHRLPEEDDLLIKAAKKYYSAEYVLPVAGSQAAIQVLPLLRDNLVVAIPDVGYSEHENCWLRAGHEIIFYQDDQIDQLIEYVDVLVIINPNNPTGIVFSKQQLLNWHQRLQQKRGWLIVDEAFADCAPENSLTSFSNRQGLIILRSLGKFFGLAGIRSGFVFSNKEFIEILREYIGPWTLSGPTAYLSRLALNDKQWQLQTLSRLQNDSAELANFLAQQTIFYNCDINGCELFQTVFHPDSNFVYEKLAENGLLCRLLDNQQGLRFGLMHPFVATRGYEIMENVFKEISETEKRLNAK